VNAVFPAQPRMVPEQADVIDLGRLPGLGIGQTHALHHVGGRAFIGKAVEERAQSSAVGLVDAVVRIQPEDPGLGGVTQALITCRRCR
jgi:hypothetical protein